MCDSSSITRKHLLECSTEIQVENRINNWIERRIDVSEPCDQIFEPPVIPRCCRHEKG